MTNKPTLTDRKKYEDHIRWLEASIDSIREDNETLSAQLQVTKKALNDVVPLRRHLKRQIRHHFSRADKKISNKLSRRGAFTPHQSGMSPSSTNLMGAAKAYDTENFVLYRKAARHHILMPVYSGSKRAILKTVRKTKRRVNK